MNEKHISFTPNDGKEGRPDYKKFLKPRLSVYFCSLITILITFITPAYGIQLIHGQPRFVISDAFDRPSDISVSGDGRIYVVDGVNNKIKIFQKDGKFLSSFGKKGSNNGEFRFPLGIDIDPRGRVYIADSGNHRVQIFDRGGNFVNSIVLPFDARRPTDPTDVAVDVDRGRCYIVDNDNHRILVHDLFSLKRITTYGRAGTRDGEFRYPFLMTLDREKYLYIVDVINTRVQVLNPEGLFVNSIGGWGVEKGHFFRPKGVAVDKNGRVFVSDSYMGVIQIFDPSGSFYAAVGDPVKDAVKKFETPMGLYVDNGNRLYVVEMFANRISVFNLQY